MQVIKYFILILIFVLATVIGKFLSRKYTYRLEELEDLKNAFNILKSKIKFTYEPLPEIFEEISNNTKKNISKIFETAREKMRINTAQDAWIDAIDESITNLKEEDENVLKMLSKLLGQTDVQGQISQIDITQNFLESQIEEARNEKDKNESLYKKLGTTIGLVIVIILI